MYPFTEFQLIWRTSDFGTKFTQKCVNVKNFGKINIKFEMRIQQCTPVPNFSQFRELQFLKPNLSKKETYFKKKLIFILSKRYHNMAGFRWFQVVSGGFR